MSSPLTQQVSPAYPIAGDSEGAKAVKPKTSKFMMKLGRKDKGEKSKPKEVKEKDNKQDPNALNHSTGRGGFGNISRSRDAVDAAVKAKARKMLAAEDGRTIFAEGEKRRALTGNTRAPSSSSLSLSPPRGEVVPPPSQPPTSARSRVRMNFPLPPSSPSGPASHRSTQNERPSPIDSELEEQVIQWLSLGETHDEYHASPPSPVASSYLSADSETIYEAYLGSDAGTEMGREDAMDMRHIDYALEKSIQLPQVRSRSGRSNGSGGSRATPTTSKFRAPSVQSTLSWAPSRNDLYYSENSSSSSSSGVYSRPGTDYSYAYSTPPVLTPPSHYPPGSYSAPGYPTARSNSHSPPLTPSPDSRLRELPRPPPGSYPHGMMLHAQPQYHPGHPAGYMLYSHDPAAHYYAPPMMAPEASQRPSPTFSPGEKATLEKNHAEERAVLEKRLEMLEKLALDRETKLDGLLKLVASGEVSLQRTDDRAFASAE